MMHYNLQQLIQDHKDGQKIKYLFFWGHRPSPDGRITASCLSQWWQGSFEVG